MALSPICKELTICPVSAPLKPEQYNTDHILYLPESYSDHPGGFGHIRKFHTHEGIDLYCDNGTLVRSLKHGKVVDVRQFTGANVGSPWWNDTICVVVQTIDANGQLLPEYILYGELEESHTHKFGDPLVRSNDKLSTSGIGIDDIVYAGDVLGAVAQVLTKQTSNPNAMLHLELYSEYDPKVGPVCWDHDSNGNPTPKPSNLQDPMVLLEPLKSLKNVLVVGGNFSDDNNIRKQSYFVNVVTAKLHDRLSTSKIQTSIVTQNGGNIQTLERILQDIRLYDMVVWWPNIENDIEKFIPQVKSHPNLIISKNNRDMSYTPQDLAQRVIDGNAQMLIELHKLAYGGVIFRPHVRDNHAVKMLTPQFSLHMESLIDLLVNQLNKGQLNE